MPEQNVTENGSGKDSKERSRVHAFEMFNKIAPRYDLVNRVLSGGIDIWWRKQLVQALPKSPVVIDGSPDERTGLHILDVATGTGDLLVAMAKAARVQKVVGVDVSIGMIEAGHHKLAPLRAEKGGAKEVEMQLGDALDLKEHQGKFDVVTISFGIRNVIDVDLALKQMFNALRPGGKLLILEFSTPRNPIIAPTYDFYRKSILPRIGGLFSGNKDAYQYLDETIATFPDGETFVKMISDAGFVKCQSDPLTFGVASLYEAYKEQA